VSAKSEEPAGCRRYQARRKRYTGGSNRQELECGTNLTDLLNGSPRLVARAFLPAVHFFERGWVVLRFGFGGDFGLGFESASATDTFGGFRGLDLEFRSRRRR
jgi:hypothetical protein